MDISVEEGKKDMVKFFMSKEVQPSLFALQMAKINGHDNLVMDVESYCRLRNNVHIKNVYYLYDRLNKSFTWNDIIPLKFRY
jgi:exoribonuclease II